MALNIDFVPKKAVLLALLEEPPASPLHSRISFPDSKSPVRETKEHNLNDDWKPNAQVLSVNDLIKGTRTQRRAEDEEALEPTTTTAFNHNYGVQNWWEWAAEGATKHHGGYVPSSDSWTARQDATAAEDWMVGKEWMTATQASMWATATRSTSTPYNWTQVASAKEQQQRFHPGNEASERQSNRSTTTPCSSVSTAVMTVSLGAESANTPVSPKPKLREARRRGFDQNKHEQFPPLPGDVTAVIIRNYPRRLGQKQLLHQLEATGFAGTFDFLYLPFTFSRKENLGYAFVNFTSPQHAAEFYQMWHKNCFDNRVSPASPSTSSSKHASSHRGRNPRPLSIAVAQSQGIDANIMSVFRDNAKIVNPKFQPVIFGSDGRTRVDYQECVEKLVRAKGLKKKENLKGSINPPPGILVN